MDPKDSAGSLAAALDFEKGDGLVTAVVQDDATGDVLMVAFMNAESFEKTVTTGEAWYWTRSRKRLWHKGEESGNVQKVKSIAVDCDGDTVLLRVEQVGGAACHTGHRSCFHRREADGVWVVEGEPLFDPARVYRR